MKPKYPTPQEYLAQYREKLKVKDSLTAQEWDHYNSLEKAHDPEAYKKRRDKGARVFNMKRASELSAADLMKILLEKDPSISFITENKSRSTTKKKAK